MTQALSLLQIILIYAIPILFAITVHEVAHGWVASRLGDQTARMMGRLTLNPIKHIDPIGTIIVPALLLLTVGFLFGWAKPVPITWRNLRHPRRDAALVAIAGPFANLVMVILWALVTKVGELVGAKAVVMMGQIGIGINLILMLLNIIPIPPLDGSRVVSSLLPPRWAAKYSLIEPYGFIILLVLILFGLLGVVLGPAVMGLSQMVARLFGL
ncbi:MAG TPA: site-2 protease family protein [Gammaproteobacteria bacterium]|nr:site-2 protease family protein [Gammaproteobacteria bacterium]